METAWCGAADELEKNPDQMEMLFTNSTLGEQFYINLFTTFSARAVLDLSAGLGEAAKAAVVVKVPYLGFCVTEEHTHQLELELTRWAGVCMGTPGHRLFDPTAPGHSDPLTGKPDTSKGTPDKPKPQKPKPVPKGGKRDLTDSDDEGSGDKKTRKKPQKKKGRKDLKARASHATSGSDSSSG